MKPAAPLSTSSGGRGDDGKKKPRRSPRARRHEPDGVDYAEVTRRFRSGVSLTRIWLEHCAADPARKITYRLFAARRARHEKEVQDRAIRAEQTARALAQVENPDSSHVERNAKDGQSDFVPPFVVIETPGVALQVRAGSLCVRRPDKSETLFPPRQHGLQSVMLATKGVSVTTDAIRWLLAEGVMLTFAERGEASALFATSPETQLSITHLKMRSAQFAALADPRKVTSVAREIVSAKFRASRVASPDAAAMLAQGKSVTDVMAAEAVHARAYWRALSPSLALRFDAKGSGDIPATWTNFATRGEDKSNRYAATPLAAMLNYAYAVAVNRVTAHLVGRGFDPAFGFLHSSRHGRASLSYDALELLRPEIDRAIVRICERHIFARADFPITEIDGRLVVRCGRGVAREIAKATSRIDVRDPVQIVSAFILNAAEGMSHQKSASTSNSSRSMSKMRASS